MVGTRVIARLSLAVAAFLAVAGWSLAAGGHAVQPTGETSYEQLLDTEVTYDNALARNYDDGYVAAGSKQFEAALAPFGTWLDDLSFGRVWIPSAAIVGADFVPYASHGRWVLTEYGWTWDSAWEWGWAPFHYGRWVVVAGRGWGWIPGTLWGPAWVTWRAGRVYVAWAALPPRGVLLAGPLDPRSPWRFVPIKDFGGSVTTVAWPPRQIVTHFSKMGVTANEKLVQAGDLTVHINAGPLRLRAGNGVPRPVLPIATAAPTALPPVVIQPRAGAEFGDRPWVKAGVNDQTGSKHAVVPGRRADGAAPLPAPPLRDVAPKAFSNSLGGP